MLTLASYIYIIIIIIIKIGHLNHRMHGPHILQDSMKCIFCLLEKIALLLFKDRIHILSYILIGTAIVAQNS